MTLTTWQIATTFLLLGTLATATAQAQTAQHQGHGSPGMNHAGMDHSNMGHADMHTGMTGHDRATHMVEARGVVVAVDASANEITLRHDAIPAVSWPAATMIFPVADGLDLAGINSGQAVQFTLHRASDGRLPLVELCPAIGMGVTAGLCTKAAGHPVMDDEVMDYGASDLDGMNHGHMDHSGMVHGSMPSHGHDQKN